MSKSPPDELHKAYSHRLSVSVNRLIKYCAWMTAGGFGFYTLWSVLNNGIQLVLSNDSLVWKIIISSYFVSWLVGVQFDKTYEEYVYNTAPRQGKLDIKSIILAAMVFLLFGIMYFIDGISTYGKFLDNELISSTQTYLSINGRSIILILLNVLWFFNIPLWWYFLQNFINPMSHAATIKCRHDKNLLGIEKILIVDNYISGQWQNYRFVIGSIILIFVDIIWIIFIVLDGYPTNYLSIILCGYLMFIEAWVWLMRAKMKYAIQALDKLSEKYYLTRRGPKAIRSPRRNTRLIPATKTEETNIPPSEP